MGTTFSSAVSHLSHAVINNEPNISAADVDTLHFPCLELMACIVSIALTTETFDILPGEIVSDSLFSVSDGASGELRDRLSGNKARG